MAADGSILLHRRLLESYIFSNEVDLKIWIWLLLKARHKSGFAELNSGKGKRTIRLKRGQLIFGRNKAQETLGIAGSTIVRHLEKMKAEKMILIEVDTQYSIITICNYDSYQQSGTKSEQPTDNQRTTNGQATDTNNNVNKENNVNNITLSTDQKNLPPDLSNSNLYRKPNIPTKEDVQRGFIQNAGTEEMANRFIEIMDAVGWYYKSSPVTNFIHLVPKFISSWNKNEVQNYKPKNGTTNTVKKPNRGEGAALSAIEELNRRINLEQ